MDLPTAIRFRPNGGPFGVMAGARVGVNFTLRTVSDAPTTQRTVITAVDGTGATLDPPIDTITDPTSPVQTRVNTIWNFETEFALGVNFFLPGDATLDVIVQGNLPFDQVQIQANFPLE